jgi:hypothetical protein
MNLDGRPTRALHVTAANGRVGGRPAGVSSNIRSSTGRTVTP